jgi:hypothetical protein
MRLPGIGASNRPAGSVFMPRERLEILNTRPVNMVPSWNYIGHGNYRGHVKSTSKKKCLVFSQ